MKQLIRLYKFYQKQACDAEVDTSEIAAGFNELTTHWQSIKAPVRDTGKSDQSVQMNVNNSEVADIKPGYSDVNQSTETVHHQRSESVEVVEENIKEPVRPTSSITTKLTIVESEPAHSTEEPVQSTEEPVQSTDEPVQSTDESAQLTDEPTQSTDEPIQPTAVESSRIVGDEKDEDLVKGDKSVSDELTRKGNNSICVPARVLSTPSVYMRKVVENTSIESLIALNSPRGTRTSTLGIIPMPQRQRPPPARSVTPPPVRSILKRPSADDSRKTSGHRVVFEEDANGNVVAKTLVFQVDHWMAMRKTSDIKKEVHEKTSLKAPALSPRCVWSRPALLKESEELTCSHTSETIAQRRRIMRVGCEALYESDDNIPSDPEYFFDSDDEQHASPTIAVAHIEWLVDSTCESNMKKHGAESVGGARCQGNRESPRIDVLDRATNDSIVLESPTSPTSLGISEDNDKIRPKVKCRYFSTAKGCSDGDKCKFLHESPPTEESENQLRVKEVRMRLANILRDAGPNGLKSSEIRSRYFELYGENVDTRDAKGCRVPLRELLISHPDISGARAESGSSVPAAFTHSATSIQPTERIAASDERGPADSYNAKLKSLRVQLVGILRESGRLGIKGSLIPKRYQDLYGTKLDIVDKHGKKRQLKDFLLSIDGVEVDASSGGDVTFKLTDCRPPIAPLTSKRHVQSVAKDVSKRRVSTTHVESLAAVEEACVDFAMMIPRERTCCVDRSVIVVAIDNEQREIAVEFFTTIDGSAVGTEATARVTVAQ
eukprot:CAMPEP_0185035052 /NCGR_PEP_ID=MMETSP1103-20130426/25727_1 /TAXON_ID=36769 /ORGANISM="Paraphysomonas bandaiensis, Strain Caron Lab Isolate" /LENGTH=774 /DNA_ID=CAMNT_0027571961 /DNA_START=499 /DNA_END=2824 /DNA_ORIENTATION=-